MHVVAIRNYLNSMFAGTQRLQPPSRSLRPVSRTNMADPPHPWHPYTGSRQVVKKLSALFQAASFEAAVLFFQPAASFEARCPFSSQRLHSKPAVFLSSQRLHLKPAVLFFQPGASFEARCLIFPASGFTRSPLSYFSSQRLHSKPAILFFQSAASLKPAENFFPRSAASFEARCLILSVSGFIQSRGLIPHGSFNRSLAS